MRKTFSISRIRGFAILTLLLAAVAFFVVLGAVFSLTRTNVVNSSDQIRPWATAVINQGYNLVTAFQKAEANGLSPSVISYMDSSGANDLLNPDIVSLVPQNPPNSVFSSTGSAKYWIYKATTTKTAAGTGGLKIPGLGSDTKGDFAFVLADLTSATCLEINRILDNDNSSTVTVPTAPLSFTSIFGTTFPLSSAPTSNLVIDLTPITALKGKMQYCVQTTETAPATPKYFYYVVAEPQ